MGLPYNCHQNDLTLRLDYHHLNICTKNRSKTAKLIDYCNFARIFVIFINPAPPPKEIEKKEKKIVMMRNSQQQKRVKSQYLACSSLNWAVMNSRLLYMHIYIYISQTETKRSPEHSTVSSLCVSHSWSKVTTTSSCAPCNKLNFAPVQIVS